MEFRSLVPWKSNKAMPARREERDPFLALRREMDRILDEFRSGFGLETGEAEAGAWMPRIDVTEDEKEVRVQAELPGMEEKDIEISLSQDVLTIKGQKSEEKEEKGKNFFRKERSYGSFHRDIELPCVVESDKVDATFKQGVLNITLPKSKEAQAEVHKIQVKKA